MLPEKGLDRSRIFGKLDEYMDMDMGTTDGRVFAYVYHPGETHKKVSEDAYLKFLHTNTLDPTVYPSAMQIETEVVEMAKDHVGAGPDVVGNFTSGGTESIILSVKTARDRARKLHPEIKEPEIVLPNTGHAAFKKAAEYLGLKLVYTEADVDSCKAVAERMEAAITPNTIMLVASAPSYAHGVVDPIEEIGQIALKHELLFHVDACVGGFLLHHMRNIGAPIPKYGFDCPGVTQLSMDLHKYGFAPKGASVILYRDAQLRQYQIFSFSGWTGYSVVNATIQSSKTAGPLAAAWALMHSLGREGYEELAKEIWEGTERFKKGIQEIPDLSIMGEPTMNLVAVASDTVNVFHVADEMRLRNWYIQPQFGQDKFKENFHLSIASEQSKIVEPFLKDLAESVEAAKKIPPTNIAETVKGAFAGISVDDLNEDMLGQFLGMAGMDGVDLPERLAEINEILNALPSEMADRILAVYINSLSRYREPTKK